MIKYFYFDTQNLIVELKLYSKYPTNNYRESFAGKSKEAEIKRVNKELANIRSKFKGDKTLDGYQKKKYVCKLLFIFLLGHDIDFGHMEAVNLLSSNKYSEKQIVSKFFDIFCLRFYNASIKSICFCNRVQSNIF